MNYDELFICSTDTVNGIGGPVNGKTLQSLYELKQRPLNKKIMILVSSLKQAEQIVKWDDKAKELANKYWPGAVSIIVNNQGFRMPNNKKLLSFLEKKGPMYVTSLNISGQDPISLNEAFLFFPKEIKIYDFGKGNGKASKIIDSKSGKWLR